MNKLVLSIIGIALILGAGFFVFHNNSGTGKVIVTDDNSTKVITINASRFQYDPGTITIKKGEHVKIIVNNLDLNHGIAIPALGVFGIESVEFTANQTGTYEFKCPTMCGNGHREMTGTLVVEE